jgi:chromosomal replication initiator protein
MGLVEKVIAVVEVVQEEYNVDFDSLSGKSRKANVREARQLAIHFLHKHLGVSINKSAKLFNRHHSTAIHGNYVVANEIATNKLYQRRYAFINGLIINKINNG